MLHLPDMASPKSPPGKSAPRNRTMELSESERKRFRELLFRDKSTEVVDRIICGDSFTELGQLPRASFDLIFADPPYNLSKKFGSEEFHKIGAEAYEIWLDSWLALCSPLLKDSASIYICGDWRSSAAIQRVGSRHFHLRNRITWEREKGRGAKANWKNVAEDIWFFTASDTYTFNTDAVKQRRRVLAPYTKDGEPKDWDRSRAGNFRDTHPSNVWTDITVPFWSMPENTVHPTQKPEKLIAKIILASTKAGDLVLDPFAGSGTTAVVAKKLGRHFVAIEADDEYCLLVQKRLELAEEDRSIQGFEDGVFWERNSKIPK